MRLAFFDFVTHFGGAQRSTVELAARLAARAEVEIIDAYGCCEGYLDAVRRAGLNVHVLRPAQSHTTIGRRGNPWRRALAVTAATPGMGVLAARLRRHLGRRRPDAVWTNSPKGLAVLTAASVGLKPAILYFMRGWYRPSQISRLTRGLLRRRAAAIMALSSRVADNARRAGIPTDKVAVVPNALDAGEVRADADRPLEAPLPQQQRPVRLLLPGTLLPAKGQLCAIRALARLARSGLDVTLYLAGDVSDKRHEEYVRSLKETADELGVSQRVCFLGWRNDLLAIMKRSTMVILPSETEGMPRSLMEAMLLRRPVAATPVGGVPDLVVAGRTGWLFDVGDDLALAEAVREAHDPLKGEPVVEAACRHMLENFSPARQVEKAWAVFCEATGQPEHASTAGR